MPDSGEIAIQRVIEIMYENLGEPITVAELAQAASFSKFHFSRVFQRVTGTSPGRFLSTIRLEEAKRLLLSTALKVADISLRVGYTSVGTFSTRFTRSVGVTPTAYRQSHREAAHLNDLPSLPSSAGVLSGRVLQRQSERGGHIYLGLFRGPVPEGPPTRCTILDGPGPFRLDRVPAGDWFVLAHSTAVPIERSVDEAQLHDQRIAVGSVGPLKVCHGTPTTDIGLQLRPMRSIDHSMLLALLAVRRGAKQARQRQHLAA